MKKSLESRTLESSVAGGVLFVLSFVQSIILVPIFLQYWGKEKYGAWLTIFAFASLLKTLDLGHQNYVGNEFNKAFHTNKDLAHRIFSSAFIISILLGIAEVLIYIIIAWFGFEQSIINVDHNYIEGLDYRIALLLFIIIWGILGSIGGLLVRMVLPLGLFAKTAYLSILYKLGEVSVLLLAVYLKWSLFNLLVAYAAVTGVFNVILYFYVKKVLPEFYPWWKNWSFSFGISNFFKSLVLTANAFIEQFNASGIVLLVSRKLGLLFVPLFTTIRTLTNMVLQITSLVTNPLAPEIIRYHSTGEQRKLICIFETNWFIGGLLVNIPFLIVAPVISYFYEWWTAGELIFNDSLYYTLTLSVAFVNFGRSYITYLSGINALRSLLVITISRVVLTIGLGILFINLYGVTGIGVAILIAEFVSSFILPTLIVSYRLHAAFKLIFDKQTWLGLAQIGLLSCFYIINFYQPAWAIVALVGFLILMVVISSYQWKLLDEEVKTRLLGLKAKLFSIVKL
jgi:O-antigen/teichoic acid export membrane protein